MKATNGKKAFFILFVLSGLFVACSKEEPVKKIDMSKRETVGIQEEQGHFITYAYLPQYSHNVSYQRHYLLIEYLKKKTGLNIRQIFPDTFDEYMRMVGEGRIDISFSNPFVYVKIAHRNGATAFARIVEIYGKKDFRGQIICRADNRQIKKIEDCKGKTWCAVDPASAGGYLYALGLFMDHGIRKEDFREITFAPGPGGKQEKVVLDVYAGKCDIGSIREGTLNVVADKIDMNQIRVIAQTRWYPGWVYAFGRKVNPKIAKKIKSALLSLDYDNPEHKQILDAACIRGIIPCKDSDFNPVRNLAARLKIDLDE
ncbi:MAG: phosphate/phosphite/phosphonate ABC transporter substrate-binding protein [Deltaproteobacteria bacterium]|nr:phosphate/phosphite/phosphonate ABC transporter substrate-binding protein [Deltaproteobacteria bacterium]